MRRCKNMQRPSCASELFEIGWKIIYLKASRERFWGSWKPFDEKLRVENAASVREGTIEAEMRRPQGRLSHFAMSQN